MVKKVFQGVVLFFALYAFAFLPLGKRTALEHVRAIIGSPAARNAAVELKGGAIKLVKKLRSATDDSPKGTSRPAAASLQKAEPRD